ncbi:threonine-phosphate decarboxylase CobD [Alkalinema pantanalense CENA528]|uniref:threonine-phosphate decarboxylase CobD n=1 Tax=Alkalinema pantanalense TaxID=1620705 RepID=UPI003D6FAB67
MNRPTHGGNLQWAATLAGCEPHAILDFSASINPLGLPNSAIAALQSQVLSLTSYPDPSYRSLRQAIGQHHRIDADWILPGNGAAELITWACRDLATHCLETILFTPAFNDYGRALRAFQATIYPCRLLDPLLGSATGSEPDDISSLRTDQSLLETLPSPNRRGVLLNNPHNPTGRLFDRSFVEALVTNFDWVVIDEAFMDFVPPDRHDQFSAVPWVERYPNLVVIRSLTKFYAMPGLRLGYAIAHPDRLRQWQQWRDPWTVNSLAAAVGEAVLQDIAYQQATYAWFTEAQPLLEAGLSQLPGLQVLPSAANFFLVQCDRSVPGLQQQLLQQYQILIRDCLSFPELGDRYFRVALRTIAENQTLLEALKPVLDG